MALHGLLLHTNTYTLQAVHSSAAVMSDNKNRASERESLYDAIIVTVTVGGLGNKNRRSSDSFIHRPEAAAAAASGVVTSQTSHCVSRDRSISQLQPSTYSAEYLRGRQVCVRLFEE